jgi:hypothetical protein
MKSNASEKKQNVNVATETTTARASQSQVIQPYLEAFHLMCLAIQIVTGHSSTAQGAPTNPTDRIFPRRSFIV